MAQHEEIAAMETLLSESEMARFNAWMALTWGLREQDKQDLCADLIKLTPELFPGLGIAYFYAANRFMREDRFSKAIPLLLRALDLDRENRNAGNVLKYARFRDAGNDGGWLEGRGRKIFFKFAPGNFGIDHRLYLGEWPEYAELVHSLDFIGEDSVVVDVGANVGCGTIFWSLFSKAVLTVPFEVLPTLAGCLRVSLAKNKIENCSTEYLGIAAAEDCEGRWVRRDAEANRTTTSADTGDHLIDSLPIDDLPYDNISFIKVDAEEATMDALRGCAETARTQKPVFMVEVSGGQEAAIHGFFEGLDYAVEKRFPGAGYENIFFVPRSS